MALLKWIWGLNLTRFFLGYLLAGKHMPFEAIVYMGLSSGILLAWTFLEKNHKATSSLWGICFLGCIGIFEGGHIVSIWKTNPWIVFIFLLFFFLGVLALFQSLKKLLEFRPQPTKVEKICFLALSPLLFLFSVELFLRIGNQEPIGLPKLKVYKDYYADESGILKISDFGRKWVDSTIQKGTNGAPYSRKLEVSHGTFKLSMDLISYRDSIATSGKKTCPNNGNNPEIDSIEDALITHYFNHPINSDGFKSISFKSIKSKRKKVFLIGDSFTWGWHANNFIESFADLLLRKGYLVYNSGISGADPPQYEAILKRYLDELKPDYVIINFFLGNDLMYFDRKVVDGTPFLYPTNWKNLYTSPRGKYILSPDSLCQMVYSLSSLPDTSLAWVQLLGLSEIGKKFVKTVYSRNWVKKEPNSIAKNYLKETEPLQYSSSISETYLKRMFAFCDSLDVKVLLVAIPEHYELDSAKSPLTTEAFGELPYHFPKMKSEDYNLTDGHFNTEGHKNYAAFLDSLIQIEELKLASAPTENPK